MSEQEKRIDLRPFEMSDEVLNDIRNEGHIPVNFYSKDGAVLINKKEDATPEEIERLMKFVARGVFYDLNDKNKLFKQEEREIPLGLTDVKLFTDEVTTQLTDQTEEIFEQFKVKSISRSSIADTSEMVKGVFEGFQSQEEVMTGLLNVIELVSDKAKSFDIEVAVKRATVAMALKTRGVAGRAKARLPEQLQDDVCTLMMSALFCDIGKTNINIPETKEGLSRDEMLAVQNYPYLSYAMLARIDNLDYQVKQNVLFHRRPLNDKTPNNNFPQRRWLEGRLLALREKYAASNQMFVTDEIDKLTHLLQNPSPYDEDANILSVATDFAAMTSKATWRPAIPPVKACKFIINQSLYSYNPRVITEFLDYCSISLCDNEKILKEEDFVILGLVSMEGVWAFEIARLIESTRLQSKPYVEKLADIHLEYMFTNKLGFNKIRTGMIKKIARKARYSLMNDQSRRIVYVIDQEETPDVYDFCVQELL